VTKREKTLSLLVGTVVGGFLLSMPVRKFVLEPSDRMSDDIVKVRDELDKWEVDKLRAEKDAQRLTEFLGKTFGQDEHTAGGAIQDHLTRLLERSGLSREKFSLQPITGKRKAGAYREIGRTIRATGSLEHVINFLFLLKTDPHLHRVDSVTVTPQYGRGEVDLNMRYTTLLLDLSEGDKLPEEPPKFAAVSLDDPRRALYEPIRTRNIFLPYIKKPPEPTRIVRTQEPSPREQPTENPQPPQEEYRVVGLPEWGEEQDVFVKAVLSGQTRRYRPGDTLAGGKIVMVDYRAMPFPEQPQFLSYSRVIIQIGPGYWAVELGHSLRQRYRLKAGQFPPGLSSLSSTDRGQGEPEG